MDDGRLFLVAVMVFRNVIQSSESNNLPALECLRRLRIIVLYLNLAKIKYA